METPLTPLEFGRRSRKLYGHREAVVDGNLRLTYEQFFERCDRWSAALQSMGVSKGDRVAYIAPNTHEQLESFYAVPQTGAVLVPINYRLTADDFVYITSHSGAKVLCVHPDYLDVVDGVRGRLTGVEQFISLGSAGGRKGWQEYESLLAKSGPRFDRPDIAENDLLALNYTSGTTARPKGVMITHRNAWMNVMDTLVHFHITVDDTYLWTLPMFHANGWTFVWILTAAGGRRAHGRDRLPRQRRPPGLLPRSRGDREGDGRRVVPHRRRRGRASRRLRRDPRSDQGRDHLRRREHLLDRGRGGAAAPPGRAGSGDRRAASREVGRGAFRVRGAEVRRHRHREGADQLHARAPGALQGAARRHVRERAAQDSDRQDPEVRAEERRGRDSPPVGEPAVCIQRREISRRFPSSVYKLATTRPAGGQPVRSSGPRASRSGAAGKASQAGARRRPARAVRG